MPLHFFDTRDGADFTSDTEGLHLNGMEAARDEATRGLADLAKESLPGCERRELSIEVRDEKGSSLLTAALWFEVLV
jgi:hypothetical protein